MKKLLVIASFVSSLWAAPVAPPVETFNLAISLWNTPTVGTERDNYEQVINHFANAVFQATNGGAKIGRINVYSNATSPEKNSIMWGKRRKPAAYINGYTNGGYILFADTLQIGDDPYDPADHMNIFIGTQAEIDVKTTKAGYVLAHEFMHYVYGLGDQYKGTETITNEAKTPGIPRLSDIASDYTLMSDYLDGVDEFGDVDEAWMNLDVFEDIPQWKKLGKTAQSRMYQVNTGTDEAPVLREAASWDVLAKNNIQTPDWGARAPILTYDFTSLSAYVPLVSQEIVSGINTVTYRHDTQLDPAELPAISWVAADEVAIEFIMDVSGSMGSGLGSKLRDAKDAAIKMVDGNFTVGTTWAGLVQFTDAATVVRSMAKMTTDTHITNFKTAIDGIGGGGGTQLYQGMQAGFTDMTTNPYNADGMVPVRAAFVLADGDDDGGIPTKATIIASYKSQGIPVFTFGYQATPSSEQDLSDVAVETGGIAYVNLTTPIDLNAAFVNSLYQATAKELIVSDRQIATNAETFSVSGQWKRFEARFHNTCPTFAATFTVGGVVQTPTKVSAGGEIMEFDVITTTSTKTWSVTMANCPPLTFDIWRTKSATGAIVTNAEAVIKPNYSYPSGALLVATAYADAPLTGLTAVAEITFPVSSAVVSVNLNDDGLDGDAIASDGIYSVLWDEYTEDGVYSIVITFDNDAGTARTTYANMRFSNGQAAPSVPYTEPFDRVVKATMTIEDMEADDHGDDTSDPTDVDAYVETMKGRMDSDGDHDVFKMVALDLAQDLIIRLVQKSENFTPVIKVYDQTGTVIIKEYNEDTDCSNNGYIVLRIDQSDLLINPHLYVDVSHAPTSSGLTSYGINAGYENATDASPSSCRPDEFVGVFELVNEKSSKCLDVEAASLNDGANVQQYDCNSTNAQKWQIEEIVGEPGVYSIRNVGSNLLLDVAWGGQSSNIQQWSTTVGASQRKWLIDNNGPGKIKIRPLADPSRCLYVSGGNTYSGANVKKKSCWETRSQSWILNASQAPADLEGTFEIKNVKSNKCVDVTAASYNDGANVQQYDCNHTNAQRWELRLKSGETDIYRIKNVNSGKYLNLAWGGSSSNVQQWHEGYINSSYWKIETTDNGAYTFTAEETGTCLDVAGASADSGANIQHYHCNDSQAQKFELVTP